MTWQPRQRPSWVANWPTPPTAPWTSTLSPAERRPWTKSPLPGAERRQWDRGALHVAERCRLRRQKCSRDGRVLGRNPVAVDTPESSYDGIAGSRSSGRLAPYGLQQGWFDLLAALRRVGVPYELNPTSLMRATLLSPSGMTKRLDRMEEAGLIERRPDPSDRRERLVRLTRRGKNLIDRAVETHVGNEARLLSVLTAAERRTLDRVLKKLLIELERTEPRS
jgi:DNA-binding MarR family transcriptional regulator